MKLSDADAVPTRSVTTSNNERLPYDILGPIFHQYSLMKPSNSGIIKLETLLLVCRAWYFAALGHGTLWSHLEMEIYELRHLLYWKIHVPLRLSRSSPTALLDVVLITALWYRKAHSPREIEMLRSMVLDVVGPEGCVAKRWRSLRLGSLPDAVLPLFCVSTPNLVDLELQFLGLQRQRLPETLVLKTFRTINSIWLYPGLQNVTDLTIKGQHVDTEAISKAQKLIKLTVMYDGYSCQLRGEFPVLKYLYLEDVWEEDFLSGFSAPRLKLLSLENHHRRSYRHMLKCPGIQFHALEELVLGLDSFSSNVEFRHHQGARLVLQAAVNINVLRVTSRGSFSTMLKILDDLSICQNHHFTLKYLGHSMTLRQGQARRASIAAIRLGAGL